MRFLSCQKLHFVQPAGDKVTTDPGQTFSHAEGGRLSLYWWARRDEPSRANLFKSDKIKCTSEWDAISPNLKSICLLIDLFRDLLVTLIAFLFSHYNCQLYTSYTNKVGISKSCRTVYFLVTHTHKKDVFQLIRAKHCAGPLMLSKDFWLTEAGIIDLWQFFVAPVSGTNTLAAYPFSSEACSLKRSIWLWCSL